LRIFEQAKGDCSVIEENFMPYVRTKKELIAMIDAAIAKEREACAEIADSLADPDGGVCAEVAHRIRNRNPAPSGV
jgi:hypothetical protein